MRYKIAEFFATVCYLGKIRLAPGTFGSFPAFPICYIIMYFTLKYQVVFPIGVFEEDQQGFISLFIIEIIAVLLLFIIGTYSTAIYIKNMKEKDPSEVVIDETVGQMLTLILCSFSAVFIQASSLGHIIDAGYIDFLFLFLLPFILFRLFDILKPWPINWLDNNIPGALGVMIDDIAAAIFATVCQYAIVFLILNFYR